MSEETTNAELIAAMQGMVVRAPEPAGLRPGEVIHAGDTECPVPIMGASVTSAGYAVIYDRRTGEPSMTNMNMLPQQLKKLHPDGSPVYTVQKPAHPPRRGQVKCMLHKDVRPPEYDEWGLPACPKGNLLNRSEMLSHMKLRHPRAWEAIEEERGRREKEEDRRRQEEHQRQLVAALAGRVEARKGTKDA